jgi:phytoene/squalene synthetase
VNLLGQGAEGDASREERPGSEWRADSLARSRHARLDTSLEPPATITDPGRAAAVCAEVCRATLGDFAPALVLLPGEERRRCQALVAHVRVLFDFARDHNVEGERLAQINRWLFALDSALDGEPAGQPVHLAMAREHARRSWPEEALGRLAAGARLAVTQPVPATPEEAERRAAELAAAAAEALLGEPAGEELAAFGAALVRLAGLQHLGGALARSRWPLAASELPAPETGPAGQPPAGVLAAVERECRSLRPRLLRAAHAVADLDVAWRRAALFALLAALSLLGRLEGAGTEILAGPPRLGVAARLSLLLRARWGKMGKGAGPAR